MHTPAQAPPLHTYWHGTGLPYWPLELHVSTPLPVHCVDPGTHDPAHPPLLHTLPPLQTYVQTDPVLPHVPIELHVCGCSGFEGLHWVAPGEHTPEQAPDTQAWLVHATALPQWPVVSQVCTPLLVVEHCVVLGLQTPLHAPPTHAWLVQRAVFPQLPFDPHV